MPYLHILSVYSPSGSCVSCLEWMLVKMAGCACVFDAFLFSLCTQAHLLMTANV